MWLDSTGELMFNNDELNGDVGKYHYVIEDYNQNHLSVNYMYMSHQDSRMRLRVLCIIDIVPYCETGTYWNTEMNICF